MLIANAALGQYVSGPTVDARDLDVGGVRLGMDLEEAVSAIARQYDIEPSVITVRESPIAHTVLGVGLPTEMYYASAGTGGIGPGGISDGWSITVSFVARVPFSSENPVGAWSIVYELPWSGENVKAMTRAAREKYGEPTAESIPLQWCDRTANWASCESDAVLSLNGTRLKLQDVRMIRDEREALEKDRATTPRF